MRDWTKQVPLAVRSKNILLTSPEWMAALKFCQRRRKVGMRASRIYVKCLRETADEANITCTTVEIVLVPTEKFRFETHQQTQQASAKGWIDHDERVKKCPQDRYLLTRNQRANIND